MVMTKACPRCRGDLAHVRDVGDSYHSCVQCGFVEYHPGASTRSLHEVVVERPRPVVREDAPRRRLLRRLAERQRSAWVA